MDEFVETLFDTYWKVNENGEYMSLTDCFCFHCKEFVYHENGATLEIGMEISSLYLSQMEIKDLKIYMIDC